MSKDSHQPVIQRIARKVGSAIAEANYAQRRTLEVRLAPDKNVFAPQHAPDTYGEFLFRTSGVLPREPSARARAAGRGVTR